jgi:glucoamylase
VLGLRTGSEDAALHAQLVRLAWSVDAGRPVEQPSVVARRYAG